MGSTLFNFMNHKVLNSKANRTACFAKTCFTKNSAEGFIRVSIAYAVLCHYDENIVNL